MLRVLCSAKTLFVTAVLLVGLSLPAHADSFGFSGAQMIGVNSTVAGSFSYDASSHTVSLSSLTFSGGAFNGVSVNLGNVTGNGNTYVLSLFGTVFNANTGKYDAVTLSIVLNQNYQVVAVAGGILDPSGKGGVFYDANIAPVPEGSSWMFLIACSAAICAGMFKARNRFSLGAR